MINFIYNSKRQIEAQKIFFQRELFKNFFKAIFYLGWGVEIQLNHCIQLYKIEELFIFLYKIYASIIDSLCNQNRKAVVPDKHNS